MLNLIFDLDYLALYPTPTNSNSLVHPLETPSIILDNKALYKPCLAL